MAQHNLTRAEAAERAAQLQVTSYEITLVLDGQDETFRSVTTVRFTADSADSTFIDAITAHVHRIELNGEELPVDEHVDTARIQLPGLAPENELTIDADFFYMNTGEGLHRFVDPVDDETYLYTQFEVPDARRVFAVFEQPDLKASFSFTVVAPEAWTVVSNSPTPVAGDPAEVLARLGIDAPAMALWQFAPTPPISSYITALIAGPYKSAHSSLRSSDGEEVPLGVYARASLFEHVDAEEIFALTRSGFAFFEELFDTPYPFEKFDQLFVPEFNAGAMENAGAVTIVEDYVFRSRPKCSTVESRAVTILHELAHMWFGDLVTMRWWNDLWLNESFAEFTSTLATAEASEFADVWTSFATVEKAWAYQQDQLPSTHPIVAPIEDLFDVEVNFDGITYAKGAAVLKQLVAWVGREEFFAGVKQYFDAHAWANTELGDLLTELEATSGRDLRTWSQLWLEESGMNLLRPLVETDEDGTLTRLAITQEAVELPGRPVPSLRPHRLAVGSYDITADGRVVRTDLQTIDLDGPVAEVPVAADAASRPDIIVVNDGDLTYAKTRLDELSLRNAIAHASGFEDSLTQLLVFSTVWDMVRDGELPAQEYLRLVGEHAGSITHSAGLHAQLRQAKAAITRFLPPALRSDARTRFAADLWELLHAAPAGSDSQLQFLIAFAEMAESSDQLDRVAQMLSSQSVPVEGVTIDTDLRWMLVVALAAADRLDTAEIDREQAADNTAMGRNKACTARAAMPTAAAKSQAFRALVDDRSLPNAVVAAMALGFPIGLQQADGTLLPAEAPIGSFAGEYFELVTGWWESRTLEIAQTLTLRLYPPAAPEAVEQTRQWLAEHPAAPKGLLRLMGENLDNAERDLRAQQTAAQHAEAQDSETQGAETQRSGSPDSEA